MLAFLSCSITTIVWVIVAPGGVQSWDFLWLGIAVVFDAGWAGGAAKRRRRQRAASAAFAFGTVFAGWTLYQACTILPSASTRNDDRMIPR